MGTENKPTSSEEKCDLFDRALLKAHRALNDPGTMKRMAAYYHPKGTFTGASFLSLEPNLADEITAVDLLATSLLSIEFGPHQVRRVIDAHSHDIKKALEELPDLNLKLEDADDDELAQLESFYSLLKPLLSHGTTKNPNRWVAASKLVARKRPNLAPIRDQVVCEFLRDKEQIRYRDDCRLFRHLMRDESIRDRLREIRSSTAARLKGALHLSRNLY